MVLLAGLVVVFAGIHLAAPVLLPVLLAGFLATVTSPLVSGLRRAGAPRGIAVLAALLVVIAIFTLLGMLVGGSLGPFFERLPHYEAQLDRAVADSTAFLAGWGISEQELASVFAPGDLLELVGVFFRGFAGLLSNTVLVLIVLVFMLVEAGALERKLAGVLSSDEQLARFTSATYEVEKYLGVKTATSAVTGLLAGAWCWMLGVDFPMLWGLLAFALNFIPTVGSIVAAVPPIAVAWIQLGPGSALAVAVGYLAVNFAIGNFLEPRILGRALGLSALVVVLSVMFWGWLLGPLGAVLGVPLTMLLKILLTNSEDLAWIAILLEPAPPAAPKAPSTGASSAPPRAPE